MHMPLKALFARPGVGRAVLVSGLALGVLVGCGGTTTSTTAPTVTSFTPASGLYNSSVTVTGTGFEDSSATYMYVYIGGVLTSTGTISSDTSLTLTVPAAAVNGPISVVTNLGTGTSTQDFVVLPSIASLSKTSAAPGDSITVTGYGLKCIANVELMDTTNSTVTATIPAADFTAQTANTLTFTIPTGVATSNKVYLIPQTVLGIASASSTLNVS